MRRVALALAALGACTAPPAALRLGPAPRPAAPPSTTSSTEAPEGVRPAGRAASASTTAPSGPVIPPASPPAGGTTSASWYGAESGARTANGERYDPEGLTFAHRSLPFGTAVRFCRAGVCVVARCSDRGPASWTGRDFDLSRATFAALAPLSAGVATVTWEVVG